MRIRFGKGKCFLVIGRIPCVNTYAYVSVGKQFPQSHWPKYWDTTWSIELTPYHTTLCQFCLACLNIGEINHNLKDAKNQRTNFQRQLVIIFICLALYTAEVGLFTFSALACRKFVSGERYRVWPCERWKEERNIRDACTKLSIVDPRSLCVYRHIFSAQWLLPSVSINLPLHNITYEN